MARRLLIRPGAIGDFIVSLPALEFLSDDYTEIWTASPNVALARFADRARSIASTGLDRLGLINDEDVVERLRHFDSIHSWYGAANPDFRECVTRLNLPFAFHAALPAGPLHAIDFYASQVGGPPGAIPHIECRLSQRVPLVILHPFASSPTKRWPLELFQALAEKLSSEFTVRWCRGPEETLEGAFFVENLYELGATLASATVYVGNDSGISHLAAAVGTPVAALFGPTDSAIWAPRGRKVSVMPMNSSPEQVLDSIRSRLLPLV